MRRNVWLAGVATAVFVGAVGFPAGSESRDGMTLRLELFVADVEASAAFYEFVLGFERLAGSDGYLPVRNGSVTIGLGSAAKLSRDHYFNPELQTQRPGLGTEVVLEVPDVEAAYARVRAAGHSVLSPLRQRPWGLQDFRIADPDGYYLRITSRPEQD